MMNMMREVVCKKPKTIVRVIGELTKQAHERWYKTCAELHIRMHEKCVSIQGQGTTEYAILVGVLVVIAIVAITLFKPKIEELWNAIAVGINSL